MRLPALLVLSLSCTGSDLPEDTEVVGQVLDAGPDILLITIDTLRADRVGAYGDPLAQTPALDALAAQGALFREAHAVTPLTLPSHASLLTGMYPVNHGLRDNAGFRLAAEVPTLAEALDEGGYQTAAFVSAYVLDSSWGLDQGFDTYRDPFHPEEVAASGAFGEVELPSAEVINAARAWWRGAGESDGPRFAWVHLYDPHTPWRDRPDWEGDPYRGEVAYADAQVGKLLGEVGDDVLVVVSSDHGESLWTQGEREHGLLVNPHATRVPLLVRPPGGLDGVAATVSLPADRSWSVGGESGTWALKRPAGEDPELDLTPVPEEATAVRVVEDAVSGVDVAPTIADYAGVELIGVDGRSLRPLVQGESLPPQPVYAESWFATFHLGWASMHAVQLEGWRLERGAREELVGIDISTPPPADTLVHLGETLERLRGEGTPSPGEVDAATADALQALGYLTAAPAQVTGERADARDRIEVLMELHAAQRLAPQPRLRALEDLLIAEPDMADAALERANTLAELGDLDGAWEATEAVLDRWPDHPLALSNAGVLARQRHEGDLAIQIAKRMQILNPRDARGYRLEAAVGVDQEDAPGVLDATSRGLQVAPEDPNLHYLHALAQVQVGDPALAVTHLEAAREHGSRASDIDLWLGVAHERAGNVDDAVRFYDAATRSMKGDPRPWAMAGWMLYKADRCAEALPYLINVGKRGASGDPQVQEAFLACSEQQARDRVEIPKLGG